MSLTTFLTNFAVCPACPAVTILRVPSALARALAAVDGGVRFARCRCSRSPSLNSRASLLMRLSLPLALSLLSNASWQS